MEIEVIQKQMEKLQDRFQAEEKINAKAMISLLGNIVKKLKEMEGKE